MAGKTRAAEPGAVATGHAAPGGEPPEALRGYYRQMALIRAFELRAAEMYTRAKIGGYCHLNLGEEATVVGLMAALEPRDYLFTTYREHGYALARGTGPRPGDGRAVRQDHRRVRRARRLDAPVRREGPAARRVRHRRRADSAGHRGRAGADLPRRAWPGRRGGDVPAG